MELFNQEYEFAKRPPLNPGMRNQKNVELVSNHLRLGFRPNERRARQYAVRFLPEIAVDNLQLKRMLLKQVWKELRPHYHPYFQSGDTIFSPKVVEEPVTVTTMNVNTEYAITIELTGNEIDLNQIRERNDMSLKLKAFLENLMKTIISANNGLVRFNKRSTFDYNNVTKLDGGSYLMPGYTTSINITESGLFFRVALKNKFISGKTCYDKLSNLRREFTNGSFERAAREFFENHSVMTTYGSYKVYRVNHITFDMNVSNKTIPYKDRDGNTREITLLQYYKEQYNVTIKDTAQPLLVSLRENSLGQEESIYLVPELCYLTGLDDEMRDNEGLKKGMMGKARLNPNERMNSIASIKKLLINDKKFEKTNRRTKEKILDPSPNEIREEWGLTVGEFITLRGRELRAPDITFQGNNSASLVKGKIRYMNVFNTLGGFPEKTWAFVCSKNNQDTAYRFIDSLVKSSKSLGVTIQDPKLYLINGRKLEEWTDDLRQYDFNGGLRMVMVMLDRHTKHYYSSLKNFFYREVGIPTQNVLAENSSKNLSYFSNVLIQMIAKLGGQPYAIHVHEHLHSNPTMIIGYDSAKAGHGKTKFLMCASYDKNLSKFHVEETYGDQNQDEAVGPVGSLLRKCLDRFNREWKIPPKQIIIYRSGVNDIQKKKILKNEIGQIVKLFSGNEESYKVGWEIKFSYIVANKKTDVKFFEMNQSGLKNPSEGLVVDTNIVCPDTYEFYLQPQFVNQGTATPTHFQCIYDTNNIPLEILEEITYRMCYYYWNWPGAIREPAALKFAEVANTFNTKHLKGEAVLDRLKGTPYFI